MIRGLRVPVHLTSREALRMFDLADIWAARTGHHVRLVSANDHVHSRGSAHYAGLAVDLHSSDPDGLSELFRRAGYRVLWDVPGHYAHVHVEQAGPNAPAPSRVAVRAAREASSTLARTSMRPAGWYGRDTRDPGDAVSSRQPERR